MFGTTAAGRHLLVVIADAPDGGVGIVTAKGDDRHRETHIPQEGQLSKMTMTSDELAAVRDLYDTTDQSAALKTAELDSSTVEDPMVGITIRLPASTLNTARALAAGRGIKVTALIRDWVEQQLADNTDDQRVVSVAELRRLIAHAS